MKRTFSLISAFAFVLVFCGNGFAQVVNTTAEVIQDVNYTKQTNLDYGVFQTSFTGTATIDPTGTTDNNVNGVRATDYFAGKIFITGANDQSVTVTLDNTSITLDDQSGSTTDSFILNPISLSQAQGHSGSNSGGSSLTDGGTLTLDGSGQATVWIGGDLTANDNDTDGSMFADVYENTADLTFTIDYSL